MEKFDPAEKLSDEDALALIYDIKLHGEVFLSSHVEKRMEQRNFSMRDILFILENGTIMGKNFDEEEQNWEYKLEGEDIDGDEGVVVTAIINDYQQMIISVF